MADATAADDDWLSGPAAPLRADHRCQALCRQRDDLICRMLKAGCGYDLIKKAVRHRLGANTSASTIIRIKRKLGLPVQDRARPRTHSPEASKWLAGPGATPLTRLEIAQKRLDPGTMRARHAMLADMLAAGCSLELIQMALAHRFGWPGSRETILQFRARQDAGIPMVSPRAVAAKTAPRTPRPPRVDILAKPQGLEALLMALHAHMRREHITCITLREDGETVVERRETFHV